MILCLWCNKEQNISHGFEFIHKYGCLITMDHKKEEELWNRVAEDLTELSEMNEEGVKFKVIPSEEPDYYKAYRQDICDI